MQSDGQVPANLPSQTASDSESNTPDPSRLPPYWHEDGDVILRVEADDATKRDFRIHRLMLCLHSPVFRDMFSLGENAVKDEIPAVPMKGDSVEDVRELLKVIYRGYELYCNTEFLSFEGVLGVLRLSHKYQMEQLKNFMVKLLKRSWPLNYEEYKEVLASLSDAQMENRISRSIRLINTARLTGCNELLPPAFFEIANSDWTTWTREVDGAEFLCPEDWLRMTKGRGLWVKRFNALERAGRFDDCMAYVWDKNRNTGQQVSIFQLRSQSNPCSGSDNVAHDEDVEYCLEGFECLESLIGRTVLDGDSFVDACSDWTVETFKDKDVCEHCAHWMVNLIKNKETEIWENVPADFDLPEVDENEYAKTNSNKSLF